MTTCPSGVHYQHLVDHARVHVERTYRRPWREKMLRALLAAVLPYPRRLRAALAGAAVMRAAARGLPGLARPLSRRLPASWRALLELAAYDAPNRTARSGAHAPIARGSISDRGEPPAEPAPAAASTPMSTGVRGRVALLAGCAQSVLTPRTQAACIRLIERNGFEAVVIEGCCGALVHHLGRADEARAFAARLIGRIEVERRRGELDAVIVNASGCGTHLKDLGHVLRNDAALAGPAQELSALARDITEWLYERSPPTPIPGLGVAVAYHSACSMQHGQQLDRIPRLLLAQAGFEVRDIPEGHLCCGSAGTYNILQPELAGQLRERKLANIRGTSARLVATGNVGCIVQLSGAGIPIVHTAELLDWAAGGPAPVGIA
jgi:glycolate oxidase iron-sulfur subunit